MTRNGPDVVEALPQVEVDTPGAPPGCRRRLVETARLHWSATDGGDPADLAQRFLAAHGVTRDDLTRPGRHDPDDAVCGAALYLSAAAGAYTLGVSPGAPSPAPTLPDLVVVVYHHTDRPTPTPPPAHAGGWRLGPWRDSWTPAAHAAAVDAVRAAIARGDVYQTNLVGHAAAPYTGDPRPAGGAGRRELLASAKERAEHVMIVDLERNDLARVARTGSVRVDELFAVRRWCDLWQAESTVSAAPADGLGLADLLRAVCPGGSVTGAPKRAALAQIAALEPVGRGASMGALGWVGPDRLDLGLTIRTAAADGDLLHLWAGGGITWDSDPAAEVAEAAAKAAPIRALLAG
ncbi:chorismate-binding protein [Micromonospora sp. R42106]|uniref:chorismate-binding protein n=1 Tax=Micromonospora sp. R42106 TaxID=2929778 RepID=UPI001FF9AFA0|nr:chorismate-binding protein [Micromonospora sp. R42106]MCK1808416.1 chorismate-binding protein [Micromonospora sp. R42106]